MFAARNGIEQEKNQAGMSLEKDASVEVAPSYKARTRSDYV